MEENRRQQAFIERLLRHQAFNPFLEDLVKEQQEMSAPAPLASMPSSSTPVAPAPAPAPAQFQFSQPENTHVGMTMIPETQLDFSMLNINNNNANWNMGNGFNGYQPRVFAVTELPEGPANPLDISAMSGKGHSAIFAAEDEAAEEEVKADYPVIECPVQSEQTVMAAVEEDDAEDDEYDLYRSSPAPSTAPSAPVELAFTTEKASRFTLVVADEASEAMLAEGLEKKIAAMEPAFQRIAAITSTLDC